MAIETDKNKMVFFVESDDIHPAWVLLNIIGHFNPCWGDAIIDLSVNQRSRMR